MLYSIVNLKGGQGKTLWSAQLAPYFEANLLDLNPENGDAAFWAQLGGYPCREVHAAEVGAVLQEAAASKITHVADCPPWEGPETRSALAFSQAVLVPVGPAPQDVRGLVRLMDLVHQAKEKANPSLRVGILGTGQIPCAFAEAWEEALKSHHHPRQGVHFLGSVPRRQDLLTAFGAGEPAYLRGPSAHLVREALEAFAAIIPTRRKA